MAVEIDKQKSAKILEKVKAQKDQSRIVNVDVEMVKFVLFKLADEYFGLYGEDVKEILPTKQINYVPGSPDFILGVINVRGDLESVIDLHGILGFSAQKISKQNRIIIVQKSGFRSGFLVRSVEDVLDFPKPSIKETFAAKRDSNRDFVRGALDYKEHCVALLDTDALFTQKFNDHK